MTTSSSSSTSKIYDLSHPLTLNTPIYPGDPPFARSLITTPISSNHIINVHQLGLGTHTGTHIDAPSHFTPSSKPGSGSGSGSNVDSSQTEVSNLNLSLNEGRTTIDQVPLESLMGPVTVIDLTPLQPHQKINWSDIEPLAGSITTGTIVFFYTGWYEKWGTESYFEHPFLDCNVASEILKRGVRVMGTDTLSPDETLLEGDGEYGFGFHEKFLGAGGIIAENLNNLKHLIGLSNIFTTLLPLKLVGCDGSPVRAIAWQK